jgi:hypothetical protein
LQFKIDNDINLSDLDVLGSFPQLPRAGRRLSGALSFVVSRDDRLQSGITKSRRGFAGSDTYVTMRLAPIETRRIAQGA